MLYRLLLPTQHATGFQVDTGANYPGCARDNPDACVPLTFPTVEAAEAYAVANGEEPVLVRDAEEAWQIVEGTIVPSTGFSSQTLALGIGALLLFRFLRKR